MKKKNVIVKIPKGYWSTPSYTNVPVFYRDKNFRYTNNSEKHKGIVTYTLVEESPLKH